jgi:hypothetical protein
MRLWLSRVWADANQVHEASTHQLGPVRDRIGAATAPRDPLLPARMHLVGVAPMARLRDEALSLLAGLPGGDALTLPGSAGRETVDSFFSPEYAEARLPALTAGGNSTGPLTAAGVFANELGTLSVAFRPTGYTATAAREWELESSAAGVYPLSSTATTSSFIGARAAGALGHRDGAYAGAAAAGLGARAVTGRTSTETRSGAIDRNVAQKGGDVVLLRVSGDWHLDAGTTWTGSGDFLTGRGTRRGKIVPMTDAMVIAVPVRDVRLANDQIRAHNAGRPVADHLPLLATDEWLDGNFPLKGSLHVEDPDPAAAPAWHPPVGGDLGRAFPDDLADPGLYELVSGELTALGLIPADPLADEFGNTTRLRRLLGRAGLTSFVDSLLGNGAQARLYRRSGVAWTFGLFKSTTGAEVTVRGRLDGFRLTEITDEKTEVEYHANTAVTSSTATTTAAVLEASAAYGPGGNPSLARPPEPGSAHAGTMAPAPTAGHTHQWSATRTEGVTLSDERVVTSTGPLVQYTARLTLTVETPDGPPRHRTVPIRLRIPESATRTLPPRPAPPAPAPVPLRLAETRLDTPGGLRAWQRSGTKLPAEAVVTSFPGAQQAEEAARAALNAHIRASAEADFITHPLTGGRSTIPSAVHDLSSPEYSKSNYTTIAGDGIGSALTGPSTFPRFRVTLNRHARLGRPALARIVTDDKMERPRQTGVLHDTATAESSSSGVRLDLRTATAALETLPQQGIAAPGRLGPETAGAATTKSQYVTGSNTKRAGGRTMVFTIEVEERYVVRAHGDPDGPGTGTRAVLPPIEVQLPEEVARAAGWLDVADGGARQSAAARHRDESLRAQLGETVQAWQDVLPQRAGWLKAAAAHRAGEAEAGTALQAQRAYHAARADAERASDQLADTIAGRSANPAPAPAPAVPGVPGAQRLLGVSGAGPATEIAKSARPVPAGLLLLDRQDSAVSAAAAAVPARPGSLTLFVHGTDGRIEAGGRRYTAADLAAFLRAGTDWTGGPIVLVSCRTGTAAFAGELSRLLGVPVTAPDGLAWVTADGRAFATETEIGPDGRMRPRVPPTGQWRTFTDGEPGTDQGAYLGTADGPADQLSTAERWGLPDRPFDRRPILAEPAYATNAGDFELNLGSFLYQYEPAVVAARKTADRLLDVLTRQLGSRSRALRAFVKDDPGSAGQVGTGRTDEQIATLLRTGNHREVMTAVYNAAYYANEKSAPGHPHTLKQVIHDLFRAPDAEQQMRALGLDHEKLLAYRDFLDGAGRRAAYATMALGNRKQADRMLANDIFALGSLTLHGGNPLDDTWELGNSQKGRAERDAAAKAHTQPEPAAFARRGAPLSEAELAAASIPVPTGEQIRERVPFWRHDPLRPGEDPAVLLDVLSTGPDAPDLDVRYGPDDRIEAIDVIVTRAETVDPRLSDLPPDEEVTDPATGRVTRLRYQGPEFPVTWRSGRAYYRLPSTSAWYRAKGGTAGMPLVAGVSGTTARLMSVFGWLNVPGVRPEDFLLATAGWMLTSEDHSLYEILRGGEIAGIRAIEHPADSLESVDLYRALDTLGVPVDLLRGKAGLSIELPHLQHEVAAAAVRRQAAAAGISVNDLLEQLGLPRPRRESDAQWPLHPRDVEVWKEIFPAAVTERHRSPVILHSLLPHEATYLQRVAGHGAAPFLAVDRDPASRDLKRALQLHSQLFVAADDEANAETEMLVWLADNGVRADNLLFYLSPAHFVALRLYTGSNHSLLNAVLERGGAFTLRAKLNEYTAMIVEGSNAELPSALTDDPALSRAIFDHKSAVTDNNARRASRAAKAIRKRIAELKTPLYEEMRTHADLVVEALQLLPPVPSGRVFRGDWKIGALSGPASLAGGMSRTYGTDEITFGTLASTSRDEDNAIGFMENTENSYTRHRLLAELELAAHSARDISIFSAHPSEAEVLLLPGARFRVESITRPDGEHERIRAREIEPVGLARATRRPRQLIHGPDVVDLTMWPPATPPAPPSPAPSSFWGGSEPDDDGLPPFVLGPDDDADGPDVPDDILAEEDLLI